MLAGLSPPNAWAQDGAGRQPAAGEPANAPDRDAGPAPEQAGDLEALRAELRAQREELEAQRARLEEQERALLEEQRLRRQAEEDDAALDELLDDPSASYAAPRVFRLSGFMDVAWRKYLVSEQAALRPFLATTSNTFVLGNLDLMFDFQPTQGWRSLLELRFTNAPHGQTIRFGTPFGDPYERVDLTVFDDSNIGGNQVVVGGVIIERAWIEYAYRDWLNVRVGWWFTPAGIWNLDHGSPTLIANNLPLAILSQRFPLRQLGIQLHGRVPLTGWDLGYHAYISNGRTPGSTDLSEDKAFGGRVFAELDGPDWQLTAGASGYYGTYLDREGNIVSFSPLTIVFEDAVAYTEGTVGLDASLDIGRWRIRSEGSLQRTVYREGLRAPGPSPGSLLPDSWHWNAYILAAYRLRRYPLEPFAYYELQHGPNPWGDTGQVGGLGLIIHIRPEVVLKLQYTRTYFTNLTQDDPSDPSKNFFASASSVLAIAF